MVNVTISVTEELKAEMEKLSEVNWSEICRSAISEYIRIRENPSPLLEFSAIRETCDENNGVQRISIDLAIQNLMNVEVTIDRIFYEVWLATKGRFVYASSGQYLRKQKIPQKSKRNIRLSAEIDRFRTLELETEFKETFDCKFVLETFTEEFKDELRGEVIVKIPIDEWQKSADSVHNWIKNLIEMTDLVKRTRNEK